MSKFQHSSSCLSTSSYKSSTVTIAIISMMSSKPSFMIEDLYNYSEQRSIHGGCFRTSTQNMDSICETHRCSGDLPPLPDGLQGSIMFTFWSNLF